MKLRSRNKTSSTPDSVGSPTAGKKSIVTKKKSIVKKKKNEQIGDVGITESKNSIKFILNEDIPMDTVGEITVTNQENEKVVFKDLFADNGIIIFMYPRANTPGCTKQACGFNEAESLDVITSAGFKVYGLSADSPKSLTTWKAKHNFQYDLLSDPSYDLIDFFDCCKQTHPVKKGVKRSHIIIAKGGRILDRKCPISPADSFTKATLFVKDLETEN